MDETNTEKLLLLLASFCEVNHQFAVEFKVVSTILRALNKFKRNISLQKAMYPKTKEMIPLLIT